MSNKTLYKYSPDHTASPGDVLDEILESVDMKKNEFARRCNLSAKTISLILSGSAPISPENALRFEKVLGISAETWMNLEYLYSLKKAEKKQDVILSEQVDQLKRFPIKELEERGIINDSNNKIETLKDLLNFFSFSSFEALDAQLVALDVKYRHSPSFESSKEALLSWLRIGEKSAEAIDTAPFDKKKFLSSLNEIRSLTKKKAQIFFPTMVELCKESGVALTLVQELKKTHLSGAAMWISSNKALIALSLRYKYNDHFWFSFFHEAAHILLHGKKSIFIDNDGYKSLEEAEANTFSSNFLIPDEKYLSFVQNRPFSRSKIVEFASETNIAPGIVVGRLQHDGYIKFSHCNDLRIQFTYSKDSH